MKIPRIPGLIHSPSALWLFSCIAAIFFIGIPTALNAAVYTWDTTSGDGSTITSGTGIWNITAGNTVWNSGGTNLVWAQTSGTVGLHEAVFAGADGAANQYTITIDGNMASRNLSFNSSGYNITSGTLSVRPNTSSNSTITVAANKTATISSNIGYSNNAPASITINSGATLNLGGGASNSQYNFTGAGTVNMTAGTYTANAGNVSNATFNQTGGTFNITPGNAVGYNISGTNQNVAYNLSGGTMTVNGNALTTTVNGAHIGIGNTSGTAFTSTLNVNGGTMDVGTTGTTSGEIQIAKTGSSNATFSVSSGTVTVGTGGTANRIYFFKAGSAAGYTANMTQSGGTVTANGIQFGGTTGTYDATSFANLTLTGGALYIGSQGITRGSAASALPITIKLEGGTIGADQNWISSLDMQLGTAGGGVTFLAQNAAGLGRSITLLGNLSDVSGVAGTLKKAGINDLILSGTNTYSGGTTINAGRLFISGTNALPATGEVTVNSGGTLSLNANGSPAFSQAITLNSGSRFSVRKAATFANVNLATSGTLTFNSDDVATQAFTLNNPTSVSGSLTIQVGGGTGTPGAVNLSGAISGSGELVKTGTGALTLSGTNTYAGNLTVSAGTLGITNNSSTANDTSTVSIVSGATLNLNYTGTDRVGKLIIAGVEQAPGVYGSSNSSSRITGTGTLTVVAPQIAVEEPAGTDIANNESKDFGTLRLGATKSLTFTIRNAGDADLSLSGDPLVAISGTNASEFVVTAQPTDSTLAEAESTTFTVEFTPSEEGVRNAELSIANNDSNENPFKINLTGKGIALPKIEVEQPAGTEIANGDTTNFGTVELDTDKSLSFTLRNTGSAELDLTGTDLVAITGANADEFEVTIDPADTIAIGDSTTFTVKFAPTGESGARAAQLSIANSDPDEDPYVINLAGFGIGEQEIVVEEPVGTSIVSGVTKDFNQVDIGTTESLTFTIRNIGGLPLSLTGTPRVAVSGTNAADFTVTTQPDATIDGGAFTTFTVDFAPSARGTRSAQLSIDNNDDNENPFLINLSGTGFSPPEIAVEEPAGIDIANGGSRDFGQVGLGLTHSLTFTIRNSGDLPLYLEGTPRVAISGIDAADFTVTARPNYAVPSAASTTFTVQFAPSASDDVGPRSAQLSIANDDSNENPFVINLTGEAVLPPKILVEQPEGTNIANNGNQNYGSVLLGSKISHTFTIRNSGDLPLDLTGDPDLVTIEGANAADFTVTATPDAIIAPGGSTTFTVDFVPSDRSPRSAKLSIANDDSNENPFVINLSGTGILPSIIAVEQPAETPIADGGTTDFGSVGQGLEKSLTFTVRNTGDLQLNLGGTPRVAVSGTNAADFTVTAEPDASVLPGGTTTFTVKFALSTSAELGARSAKLSIANNDSDQNPFEINLSGNAVLPPEIAVEQPAETDIANNSTKDFGNVGLGLNQSLTFTIRNSGKADLSLSGTSRVAISGANSADFTVTTQPDANVVADGTTTFVVQFAPSSVVGPRTAQLSIANNDSNENPFVVNLTGQAVLPPEIAVEQPVGTNIANVGSKNFGTVATGSSESLTFTISNSGDLPLSLTGTSRVTTVGGNAADFVVTTQPDASVAAKGSTTFTVQFTPSAVGARSTQLSIANNDSDENPFLINLTGTAVLPQEIAVEQPAGTDIANNGTKDFGNVGLGLNTSLTFTIRNTGGLPLSLSGTPRVAVSGTNVADFTVTTQPADASVAASGSTTFTVRFAPTSLVGARSAQLSIANNDGNENPFVINLTGQAVLPPEIAVEQPSGTDITSGGSKNFGTVATGASESLTFTIRNSGDLPLSLSGTPLVSIGGTHAADFTVTTQPSASVAAKGSTTFIVRFSPSVLGARSAQLSIANNDSNENPFLINIGGTAVSPPEIAVEQPAGTDITSGGSRDFGTVGLGLNTSLTFTISNSGDLPLNLTGATRVAVLGTNAADFTVTAEPSASVAAKGSTTFTVRFAPTSVVGARSAQLSIANNDSNENPFLINLSGTAVLPPEIAVEQPVGTDLANNSTKDFGQVGLGLGRSFTFTIRNSGDLPLSLSGTPRVAITGTNAADFTVTSTQPDASLAAKGSATFTVKFSPSAVLGSRSAQLSIANDDITGNENPFVINLTGEAVWPPDIAVEQPAGTNIANGGTKNFGSLTVGSSKSLTFTVRNTGSGDLLLTGRPRVAISGLAADDFLVTSSPVNYVASGGSTFFVVQFNPRAAGLRNAVLSIENNDFGDEDPYVINLSGMGTGATEIAVEQPVGNDIASNGNNDFGKVLLGSYVSQTFTIINKGDVTLNLTGTPRVAISGHADDFLVTASPSSTVTGYGSTTFTVQFVPRAAGVRSAKISIANNDSNENPYEINLSGTGDAGAPEIAVEQAGSNIDNNGSQSFGTVAAGSTKSLTFTIRNEGNVALNLNGSPRVDIKGTDAARFQLMTSPAASVPVGGSTSFTVQFSPGFEGPHSAYLSIANNDSTDGENPFVVNLSGNSAAEIAVEEPVGARIASGGMRDFGSVLLGYETELTFTIRNTGGESLSLTGTPLVEMSGAHTDDFTVITNPNATIAGQSSTTFTVKFAPSALGVRNASLSIANNDSDENPYVINLSGEAVEQLAFGSDHAGNYSGGWTNGSNGGTGFGGWTLEGNNYIGDPTLAGSNLSSMASSSKVFGLWSNNPGFAKASRSFSAPLAIHEQFSVQLGYVWDNGNRGLNLIGSSGEIFNFNISATGMTWDGGGSYPIIDWNTIRINGVIVNLTFIRTSEGLAYQIQSPQIVGIIGRGTISAADATGFAVYVSDAGGGSQADMRFNNLQLRRYAPGVVPEILATPADPYGDFMTSFGLTGNDALGTADPDSDGQSNDAEFAFGTDPTSGTSSQTSMVNETGAIKLVYLQRDSGVTYTVKSFTDLATAFDEGGTVVTPMASDPQPAGLPEGYTQYEASLSTSSGKGFLRVKAVRE